MKRNEIYRNARKAYGIREAMAMTKAAAPAGGAAGATAFPTSTTSCGGNPCAAAGRWNGPMCAGCDIV